jgi:hypothetical protein
MNKLRFDEPLCRAYLTRMMTRGLYKVLGFGLLLATVACAEGTPSARSADDEGEASEGAGAKKSHDDPDWYDSGSDSDKSADKKSGNKKKAKQEDGSSNAEPSFKEGMSVNDAINAIPQGLPRVNIDQEDLNRPLMETEFYKSCKLSPSQHFTIKFAVWEGRAVGIDITTTPANKNMEKCLHGLVAGYTWKDKVRSLNISTVQF